MPRIKLNIEWERDEEPQIYVENGPGMTTLDSDDGDEPEVIDPARTDQPLPGGRRLVLNGLDAATGRYLPHPPTTEALVHRIRGHIGAAETESRGEPIQRLDVGDLANTGWGVVFAWDVPEEVKTNLEPLLALRQTQAGDRFRRFDDNEGVLPDETHRDWLKRQGAGTGPATLERVPYYLLLVGSAESIPFEFQFQLSKDYAVGRLWLESAESYTNYVANVETTETDGLVRPSRAALFGADNSDDRATTYSSLFFVKPLAAALKKTACDWQINSHLGHAATKEQLGRLLGGPETPALLVTSSHGLGFESIPAPPGRLGALVCQDWPGPARWREPLDASQLFTAEDIPDEADLRGLISFHFACFSAGVPQFDSFGWLEAGHRTRLAPQPHLARLPQRLLGHPRGSLAVIGHVDRAWGFSYYWPGLGSQPQILVAACERLMAGQPVGAAMHSLAARYTSLAAELVTEITGTHRRRHDSDNELLADLWTAMVDAKSYMLLGDPAVRLNCR